MPRATASQLRDAGAVSPLTQTTHDLEHVT